MNSPRCARPHLNIRVPDKLQILFAATLGALCIATLPALGQAAKPNFSGRWELDKAKSHFGGAAGPTPKDIIVQIKQKGESIEITTTFVTPNGEIKRVEKLRTDGAPTTTTVRGHELTSMTHWQGDSLVTITRGPQGAAPFTETRTLAKNGRVLTTTVGSGPGRRKLVFLKK
jgi:hypothetical protein